MQLVLLVTFLIFAKYWVVCFEMTNFRLGDGEYLSIIIIKSEVSTFPIVVIFFYSGCVSEVVASLYAVSFTPCMYIPGKLGFVSLITVQSFYVRK